MSRAKVLGDHSQTLFEMLRNAFLNILLACTVPFVAVFTSLVGVKNGIKTRQPLRYILHGVAFLVALTAMVIIPAGLHYLTDKESKFVSTTGPKTYIQIAPEYVTKSTPAPSATSASYGKAEGINNVSFEEISGLITKNIDMAKTFYKDKDFKVVVAKSDGSVKKAYLFKKEHTESVVSNDVLTGVNAVVPYEGFDLYLENVFKEPVYEKGTITTTVNLKDNSLNDVLLAVQGTSVVYGVMYSTDAKVDYAMQRLNKIVINSLDSVITTYEFTDLTDEDVKIYNATVEQAKAQDQP